MQGSGSTVTLFVLVDYKERWYKEMKESNPLGTLFLIVVGFLFIAIIIKLIPLIKFLVNFILFLLKV